MATAEKKKFSEKKLSNTRTKKRTYKRKTPPRHTKEQLMLRQSLYIVMMFAAIFLFVSVAFQVTGIVGRWFRGVLTGFGGYAAFVLPIAMLLHAILGVATKPNNRKMHVKAWMLYGITIVISAMSNMIVNSFVPSEKLWSYYYDGGQAFSTGGVIGGFLCRALTPLLGTIGTGLVLALLFIIAIMGLLGLTLEKLFRVFFPEPTEPIEMNEEPKKEQKTIAELVEERKAMRNARKKQFNIDLSIEDKPEKTSAETSPSFDIPDFVPCEPPEVIEVGDIDMGFVSSVSQSPSKKTEEELIPIQIPPSEKQNDFVAPVILSPNPQPVQEAVPAQQTAETTAEPATSDAYLWKQPVQEEIYHYPPLELLEKGTEHTDKALPEKLRENAQKIVDTLKSFGVDAKVINVSRGPSVTRYELFPSAGVKISKITNLADDIALNLAAAGVRIEAPIPGKAAVGLEVPNQKTSMVYARDIIGSQEFKNSKSDVSVALGKDITGSVIIADIAKMPHVLIAGATGSGKSVCINTILTSILYKSPPSKVRLLMVDPKVVELGVYNGIPHLLVPVVTDPKKAAGSLNWAVTEMLKRYKLFADKNVRDMRGYNQLCEMEGDMEPLPHIVIVIDELADLMMVAPNEVEDAICRLAQMARAAGMHLVIATQRPSVDVITGTIKANIPSRIAFSVSSQVDSRTILDMSGAEKLLGKGDMLYYPVGAAKPIRVQGCFISDKEVEDVTNFIKEGGIPDYDDKVIEEIERHSEITKPRKGSDDSKNGSDEMLDSAIEVVVDAGMASVSLLQRKLKLGYARAARIVDEMEERGIVGPFEGAKPRQVTITRAQWQEMKMRSGDEN